jgi:hypothetical protein
LWNVFWPFSNSPPFGMAILLLLLRASFAYPVTQSQHVNDENIITKINKKTVSRTNERTNPTMTFSSSANKWTK